MDKGKVFWHEAHYEAVKLDLREYLDRLSMSVEYQLTQEALVMDMLIIKKDPSLVITKSIGRIFRTHNIVEYKSEEDSLGVHDYNKVLAYALLYSSLEKVSLADMSLTFSLTIRPKKLLKYLKSERDLGFTDAGNGITYIEGEILPVQIIESKELPEDENPFIKFLRSGYKAIEMVEILEKCNKLVGLDTRNVYFARLIKANKKAYKEAIMRHEELKEIWNEIADETGWFAERDNAVAKETARKTARETAKKMLELGYPTSEISIATKLNVEEVIELANMTVS